MAYLYFRYNRMNYGLEAVPNSFRLRDQTLFISDFELHQLEDLKKKKTRT